MRHCKSGIKLSRTSSHRDAMFRNMVTSLFKYESVKTTDTKAKELRRWADRLITLAKRGGLHARRQALSIIREKDVVHKLFEEATEKFANSSGGYTRITKIGTRPGDSAPVSKIELIVAETTKKKKDKKSKTEGKETKKKETVSEDVSETKEPVSELEKDAGTKLSPEKE